MSAEEHKARGNEFFAKKEFFKAAAAYSKAIKASPDNHVFYSNRSAAFMKMDPPKDFKALADADKCVSLKEDWAKGHYRRAQALMSLNRHVEALAALQRCLALDPSMKKEVQTMTKAINALKAKACKDSIELLQLKERFKKLDLEDNPGKELLVKYTEDRCESFFQQILESVKIACQAGPSFVKTMNGRFVALPGKLDTKGGAATFGRVLLTQALLSEEQQQFASKKLKEDFERNPTHAIAFITSKAALLAPRRWETLKDSLPAKHEGVFVQLASRTSRKVLFLPVLKHNGKGVDSDIGEFEEVDLKYEIIPSPF